MNTKINKAASMPTLAVQQTVVTASIRVERDLGNLDGTSALVEIPDEKKMQVLHVTVTPSDGIWVGGTFKFRLDFPDEYPHKPPKATFLGPIRLWHPNIEGDSDRNEWGVCLNILRADWKPVLGVRDVVFGLEMMFFEPNLDDPLPGTAREAAQQMKDHPEKFVKQAKQWMKGDYSYVK